MRPVRVPDSAGPSAASLRQLRRVLDLQAELWELRAANARDHLPELDDDEWLTVDDEEWSAAAQHWEQVTTELRELLTAPGDAVAKLEAALVDARRCGHHYAGQVDGVGFVITRCRHELGHDGEHEPLPCDLPPRAEPEPAAA